MSEVPLYHRNTGGGARIRASLPPRQSSRSSQSPQGRSGPRGKLAASLPLDKMPGVDLWSAPGRDWLAQLADSASAVVGGSAGGRAGGRAASVAIGGGPGWV